MRSTSGAPRILLIEDNPADAVLVQEAIRESGIACDFELAEDYDQARSQLLSGKHWHLILSDMGVDVTAADTFFRWIRSKDCRQCPPIVVYSGFNDPMRAYQAGANAFVGKARDVDELFVKIRSILEFWLHTATLPVRN